MAIKQNPGGQVTRRRFIVGSAQGGAVALMSSRAGQAQANPVVPTSMTEQPGAAVAMTLHVNGRKQLLQADPRASLLDALRESLGLTGAKKGCDHGQCGACTVLVDGRRELSCLNLALAAQGREVVTIEGLAAPDGSLHPVQQAFIDHDAFQCGYCTPGQILSAVGCIQEGHATTAEDVRETMSGNLCRCAAYPNIVAAVLKAREKMGA